LVRDLPPIYQAFVDDERARTCKKCGALHPGKKPPPGWANVWLQSVRAPISSTGLPILAAWADAAAGERPAAGGDAGGGAAHPARGTDAARPVRRIVRSAATVSRRRLVNACM